MGMHNKNGRYNADEAAYQKLIEAERHMYEKGRE